MSKSGKNSPLLKFGGCVLLSLGFLNILLALKSGSTPDAFSYTISALGAIALLSGIWRSSKA